MKTQSWIFRVWLKLGVGPSIGDDWWWVMFSSSNSPTWASGDGSKMVETAKPITHLWGTMAISINIHKPSNWGHHPMTIRVFPAKHQSQNNLSWNSCKGALSLCRTDWTLRPPASLDDRSMVFGKVLSPSKCPLVNKHSYWKWPFIVSFPIKNGDFP